MQVDGPAPANTPTLLARDAQGEVEASSARTRTGRFGWPARGDGVRQFPSPRPSADEADLAGTAGRRRRDSRPGKGWHHIAVSYRFGDPKSIRGWIDGKPQPGGSGIVGGETSRPPVVDDDEVWIGSSMRGSAANSFRGSIDAVAVHRRVLDDTTLKARYKRQGRGRDGRSPRAGGHARARAFAARARGRPAPRSVPGAHPLAQRRRGGPGRNLAGRDRPVPAGPDPVTIRRLGIREDGSEPVLTRIAADVRLEPGTRAGSWSGRAV